MTTSISSNSVQRVVRLLRIRHPLLSAPMWGASGARLATAVTRSGGLGFVSAGYGGIAPLESELQLWHQIQSEQRTAIPIGVGFIQWLVAFE